MADHGARPIRVLMFNLATDADDPVLGFASEWLGQVAARVREVHVITMRTGRVDVPRNVRVYSVGKERGYSEPRRAAEFYRHLVPLIARRRVDVCFAHMIPVFTVLAAPLLKLAGVPIVTWYAHRQVTLTLRLAHHLSDRVVTSATSAYGYRHDKVRVLGQGIDLDRFRPGGAVDVPPRLVSVGRLSPIKDPATLVAAARRLHAQGRDLRVALVGGAPERDRRYAEKLHADAGDLLYAGVLQFVGPQTTDQVIGWHRRATVHVNLCPTGAPDKAALEAMACARPSVVANEGFRETLGTWADRLMFRHGDADHLADRLGWLLDRSEQERARIGADLRESVAQRHSLGSWADGVVALLGELAGK